MKIPTELKHKPVIVSEDYDKIDGRMANNSDAKGLSLGLHNGMTGEIWKYLPKFGGIQEKNGLANPKRCLYIER